MRIAVLAAAAVLLALPAAAFEDSLFAGTWKLNLGKSRYQPGPGPKAQTIVIERDGRTTVTTVDQEGDDSVFSFTAVPGRKVQIEGLENASVFETRVDARTVEHVWTFGGFTVRGRGVLAKHGRTFTYTSGGSGRDGKTIKDYEVFERQ